MEKVQEVGSLWETTESTVQKALKNIANVRGFKTYKQEAKSKEQMQKSFRLLSDLRDNMGDILHKAKIAPSLFSPFNTIKGEDGEIQFVSKNIAKMKKDFKKCSKKMKEALDSNFISLDEFNLLKTNLNDLLMENGLELDKEDDRVVSEDEADELLETFNKEINPNIEGVIASIGEDFYKNLCDEYENKTFSERKNSLVKMNSVINTKLGIAGDISFSSHRNIEYKDCFPNNGQKGFIVTDYNVSNNNLKQMTYEMVEKAMLRKVMISKNENLTGKEKIALVNKLINEKKLERSLDNQKILSMQMNKAGG